MGLFDGIRGEAKRNFIARPDEAKGTIVYRYPENNVRMMTQLTVDSDEVALFVKDGRVEGKLSAGRHQLDAQNIPFLGALVETVTGGNLFTAEVFFVSLREFAGIKFGGPIGDVRDPETGLGIGTMVYGDFSLRVLDPEKLVLGLLGLKSSTNEEFLSWFRSQVLKVVRDRIAELMVKKRWPLLDVTSGAYTEEIESEVVAGLSPHTDSYGIQIVRLGNFHVSIKEADEATLKKLSKDVAYSKLAGGFQNYAQAQATLGAGEGMAKGGEGGGAALQGLGLGLGMAMGSRMGGGAAPQAGSVCPSCGSQASGKFCANCGHSLAPQSQKCACGADLQASAKFCHSCGKPRTP